MNATERVFDVAIIGGGINGAGVARDCAMRLLSVALFEKEDLCSGSSGACSGLIHGSPRYLHRERTAVKRSCEDTGVLQRIAPNLVARTPFLIPSLRSDSSFHLEMIETFASAYDRFSEIKGGMPHLRLTREEVQALDPGLSSDITGAVSVDEWTIDPHRLTILTAKSAVMAGAELFLKTKVERVVTHEGKVSGVQISTGSGTEFIRAKTVINLAGPWAPFVDSEKTKSLKMRPTKGVHLTLDRRIVNFGIVCQAIDGRRSVFLLPYQHGTVIGTTDDDFYGHPEQCTVTRDDVGYLMQAVERYFPSITEARITRAWAGVRPNVHEWGLPENDLSRDHAIYDHAGDGAEGFYSMIGGKLSAYRRMAEQMTDRICKYLKRKERCRTQFETLPDCTPDPPWQDESKRTGLDPITVKRLMSRHGYKAREILETATRNPELARTVCECENILAAEVEYCVREEWANSLVDIQRRTGFGLGPCQGCRCAVEGARLLGSLKGWSAEEISREAAGFLLQKEFERGNILFGEQAKQEQYARQLLLQMSAGNRWAEPL